MNRKPDRITDFRVTAYPAEIPVWNRYLFIYAHILVCISIPEAQLAELGELAYL